MNEETNEETNVRGHLRRLRKADALLAAGQHGDLGFRHVGERREVVRHREHALERGLDVGLIPTRKAAASVQRFELRGRHDLFLAVHRRVPSNKPDNKNTSGHNII